MLLLPLAQPRWRRWAPVAWQALTNILLARNIGVQAAGLHLNGAEPLVDAEAEAALVRGSWRAVVSDVNPLTRTALQGMWPVVVVAGPDPLETAHAVPPHWVVRSPAYCTPCGQQGCRNQADSPAVCMDWLSLRTVMQAVDAALALPRLVNTSDS